MRQTFLGVLLSLTLFTGCDDAPGDDSEQRRRSSVDSDVLDDGLSEHYPPDSVGCDFAVREEVVAPNPTFGPTVKAERPPVPIVGGTLLVSRAGHTAVAADPDRDRIVVADLDAKKMTAEIALGVGDEPGRLAEDASSRVHVVLRRGGAVADIDLPTGKLLARRSVCAAPRGIAYDEALDVLYVACEGGELVTLPASEGASIRTVRLVRDLRDVTVDGERLYLSTFRTALLLPVTKEGKPVTYGDATRRPPASSALGFNHVPAVAWRTVRLPDGTIAMLHQRERAEEVTVSQGGYGASDTCKTGIVQTTITLFPAGGTPATAPSPTFANVVLPVDFAFDKTASRVTVLSAGNNFTPSMPQLVTFDPKGAGMGSCADVPGFRVDGEAIAVAYAADDALVVQTREPAAIHVLASSGTAVISLGGKSVADTGHAIFHSTAGGFIACASCHPEGGDDGMVWRFSGIGNRRTQAFRGGLLGTEPFHWSGDVKNLRELTTEVLSHRMRGPMLDDGQLDALSRWLDAVPAVPHGTPVDPKAVADGKAIFESTKASCTSCHNGPKLTSNATVDVGTGGFFQVPSLRGVSHHAPFLHDGRAATLADRFDPTVGGGDKHGVTSHLSSAQVDQLIAYLETL